MKMDLRPVICVAQDYIKNAVVEDARLRKALLDLPDNKQIISLVTYRWYQECRFCSPVTLPLSWVSPTVHVAYFVNWSMMTLTMMHDSATHSSLSTPNS